MKSHNPITTSNYTTNQAIDFHIFHHEIPLIVAPTRSQHARASRAQRGFKTAAPRAGASTPEVP